VQDTRKAAGLNVSDRISMTIRGDRDDDLASLRAFADTIAADTLATSFELVLADDPAVSAATEVQAGSQRTTLTPDQYANSGVLVIDLWKAASVDV
jgi:isoleucyl-tRNA synthetase